MTVPGHGPVVERLVASAFTVPTESPESDGTLEWDATTAVVVEADGGGERGIGWAYGSAAAAQVVASDLAPLVADRPVLDVRGAWDRMLGKVRNTGRAGIAATAVSAVDTALWDLRARVLGVSLADSIGARRDDVPLYGSGGFTSLDEAALRDQLGGWAAEGFPAVKMKVGRAPADDPARVAAARDAVGDDVVLMVDANGAHDVQQALAFAERVAGLDVAWFEEPVSSDDLDGLRLCRERSPAGMEVAAGEYASDLWEVRRMIGAAAVDVVQPDVTRCGGYTAFLDIAALCHAFHVPLSAHTAPQLHAHVCVAAPTLRHVEWFFDHARLEPMLFDGVLDPVGGALHPDRTRPGNGLTLRRPDVDRFAV